MYQNEAINAIKALLVPLIKEVVLTTIEEQKAQEEAQEHAGQGDGSLVTPSEAAEQLHTTKVTLWRWAKADYLKPIKIGYRTYYRQSDIDAVKGRAAL